MTASQGPTTSGTKVGSAYKHLRKDQIRLLNLFPSSKQEAQIQCSLESFDKPPPYIALSYTWGDQNNTRKILVNDQVFKATKNLEDALKHLRHRDERLYFWVDAICMNQADEEEKQHQLRLMPIIFARAQETRVWLGPEENESDRAITLLNSLSDINVEGFSKNGLLRSAVGERASQVASRPWTDDANLVALQHLFVRSYWFRVWVVQEIAVSRKVQIFCGRSTLSWDTLVSATETMSPNTTIGWTIYDHVSRHPILKRNLSMARSQKTLRDGMHRIFAIQSVRNDKIEPGDPKERPPDSLLYLLSNHRSTEATEARDKYYALAGLIAEDDSILSKRTSAKTIEDIYVLAAESTTKELGHSALDFLDFAGWPTNISGLPSWVPDWSYARDRAVPLLYWQLSGWKHKDMVFLNAPGSPNPSYSKAFEMQKEERCLIAQGLVVDTINGVGYSRWSSAEIAHVQNPEKNPTDGDQRYLVGEESLAEAVWRTLVVNFSHAEGLKAPDHWGDLFYQRLFRPGGDALWYNQNKDFKIHGITLEKIARDQRDLKRDFSSGASSSTDEMSQLISAFDVANRYRRLATTKQGYLCLAPSTSTPEDLIVILLGCAVPVVLRREDNHLKFIGTCYVHGIMQGEAMAGLSGQQPVRFEIK